MSKLLDLSKMPRAKAAGVTYARGTDISPQGHAEADRMIAEMFSPENLEIMKHEAEEQERQFPEIRRRMKELIPDLSD